MYNPWKHSKKVKSANVMPTISERSKTIKKHKKTVENVVVEEGEEGAEASAPASDNEMTAEEEKAPSPLIDHYEKFPEYIILTLNKSDFCSKSFALENVLD